MFKLNTIILALLIALLSTSPALWAESVADLNKDTQNPVASLTSVPFQNNWTFRVGPEDKTQYIMNLQPVIPFQISLNWNIITRIVMPVVSQPIVPPGIPGAFGLSDTDLTFFLSPIHSTIIWGIGPVISLPTATERALGSSRWGLGPSIVMLQQKDQWTIGVLANQLWTLGGTTGTNGISSMLVQPFISRSFAQSWNFAFVSETTANWNAHGHNKWTIPLDFVLSKIVVLGKQAMSIGAGPRYFVLMPYSKPKWGARLVVSLLFPNK